MIKYVPARCSYCGTDLCLVEEGNKVYCTFTCMEMDQEYVGE